VLASLHDLNLASLYCDRVVALQAGRIVGDGTPAAVLTESLLREVFRVEVDLQVGPGDRPRVFLLPGRET